MCILHGRDCSIGARPGRRRWQLQAGSAIYSGSPLSCELFYYIFQDTFTKLKVFVLWKAVIGCCKEVQSIDHRPTKKAMLSDLLHLKRNSWCVKKCILGPLFSTNTCISDWKKSFYLKKHKREEIWNFLQCCLLLCYNTLGSLLPFLFLNLEKDCLGYI